MRLFHREIECYLVAEGSFANDKEDVIVEDGDELYIIVYLEYYIACIQYIYESESRTMED